MGSRFGHIVSFSTALLPLLCSGEAGAQPDLWESVSVPTAAFDVAGVSYDEDRSQALLRLIRVVHSTPADVNDNDPIRQQLSALLRDTAALQDATARLPKGEIRLAQASNRETRDLVEAALERAGLRLRERDRRWVVELDEGSDAKQRRERLARARIDSSAIAKALNAGEAIQISPAVVEVPLPLPPRVWAETIFQQPLPPRSLFRAIAQDRNAALLYYGLCGLSAETRRFLREHPDLLRWVYRERPGTLAAYGSSLRIINGNVDLPGGDEARLLWETLAHERTGKPAEFIKQVLSRDEGRLASLYQTIDVLDAPRQRFAMGLSLQDREVRIDRFRRLYFAFTGIEAEWSPAVVPFLRPMYDAATLLQIARVTADGRLDRPQSRGLWRVAFESDELPDDPADRMLRDIAEEGELDAAGVAELIALAPARYRRERFETFAFAQRVFADTPAGQMGDVLVALRAFGRYPAVMLSVDRMGVTSAPLFASVARHALAIERIGDPRRQIPVQAQFQGALAIIDRLARTRRISGEGASRLIASLVAAPPDDSAGYDGRLATWMEENLLPALGSAEGAAGAAERTLVSALADGDVDTLRRFTWEGVAYDVSIAASETRRIARVREKQGGNTVDQVLAFARAARVFRDGRLTLDAVKTAAATLQRQAADLAPAKPWPGIDRDAIPDIQRRVSAALKTLGKIKQPKDVSRAERVAAALVEAADYMLGEVLIALAYAPALGDPDNVLGGDADVAHAHDFVVGTAPTPQARARGPWLRPRRNGRTIVGSVLGLDLVLAPRALRHLASDRVPELPRMNDNDRDVFATSVVLMNPLRITDADLRRIATGVRDGRRQVTDAGGDIPKLESLAATARMSPTRRQLLAWTAAHQPESVVHLFSAAELLSIGNAEDNGTWPHAFGLTEEPLTGCYCARFPSPGPWEPFSGRAATGQLATRIPDLVLRVAELLDELRAPAVLLPWVLSLATYDFIHEVPTLYGDDWVAAVTAARRISRERMEDYVAALTAQGPLRPVAANPP